VHVRPVCLALALAASAVATAVFGQAYPSRPITLIVPYAAGGSVDVVNLPEIGIAGNSHMLMMDKNNAVTAELIQTWLAAKGLVD